MTQQTYYIVRFSDGDNDLFQFASYDANTDLFVPENLNDTCTMTYDPYKNFGDAFRRTHPTALGYSTTLIETPPVTTGVLYQQAYSDKLRRDTNNTEARYYVLTWNEAGYFDVASENHSFPTADNTNRRSAIIYVSVQSARSAITTLVPVQSPTSTTD